MAAMPLAGRLKVAVAGWEGIAPMGRSYDGKGAIVFGFTPPAAPPARRWANASLP